MGLYVEVMCDERKGWPKTPYYAGQIVIRCWSQRNDSAQGTSVARARKEARKQGWTIKGRYACCPGCAKTFPGDAIPAAGEKP